MKTRTILILSALGLCLALGMLWLFGGLTTPVAAYQATGACTCICQDLICQDGMTEAACVAAGGSYLGDNTTCGGNGAFACLGELPACSEPVGGVTAPVNTATLLLPWIFLTAAVVTGTIVVVLLRLHAA